MCDTPLAGFRGGLAGSRARGAATGAETGMAAGLLGGADSPLRVGLRTPGVDFAVSSCGFGFVGGFRERLPELVFELADPTRLMAASRVSDPALVLKFNAVSSASETLMDSALTPLPDRLPSPPESKDADSALSATCDPRFGVPLSDLRAMVMLSGPLESELPRMNIFW